MTSTPHAIGRVKQAAPATAPAATTPASFAAASVGSDAKVFPTTMLLLCGLYLLLENPYWVPGGDSEVYVAIARNLATGQGLLFNGQPVGMVPPGWPLVLAGVMKLWPTFLALKLTTLLSMVAALGAFYWIVRRFASPLLSASVVLLSGMLSHTYSLTFWLHSDAFYFTLCAFAVLVAMQINEGRSLGWRVPLLVLLCVGSVFIRWQGVLNWLLVAAVLLRGELWPRLERRWVTAMITGLATALTFLALPGLMKAMAPPPVEFADAFEGQDMAPLAVMEGDEGGIVPGADDWVSQSYTLGAGGADLPPFLIRFISWGAWFSYLLWQPLRLGAGWAAVWWLAAICGWILIGVLLVAAVRDVRHRSWLLPAVVLYTLALSLRWTQPNARYLVSLAPIILLGIVQGAELLRALSRPAWARVFWRFNLGLCIGSIILVNGLLYGIDVWVMRCGDFYDRYEAGLNKSLIAVAQYLESVGVGHGQVAINPKYENIGRRRQSWTGLRGFTMLTGKAMVSVPKRYLNKNIPRYRPFRFWLSEQRIVYYLEQPPIDPWRVWHFRVPWLQKMRTGAEPHPRTSGWRVYRCDGKSIPVLLEIPTEIQYPTRVPGL